MIALGAVVKGGTPHFDYVAGSAVNGLSSVALESGVPIGLGLLTTDIMEQAIDARVARQATRAKRRTGCVQQMSLLNTLAQNPAWT